LTKVLQQYSPVSQSLRKTHTFPQLVRESSSFIPQRKSDLGGYSGEKVRGNGDGVGFIGVEVVDSIIVGAVGTGLGVSK